MRPRINTSAQKISEAEVNMCPGEPRPRRNKAMMARSRMYTYVFETKVYIQRNELKYYEGFHISFED